MRSTSVSAGRSGRSSCRRTSGCRAGRSGCGPSCTTHRTSTTDGELLDRGFASAASTTGATQLFHTDSSFNDLPTKWSLLLAHALPPAGGNTEFTDLRGGLRGRCRPRPRPASTGSSPSTTSWHSREQRRLHGGDRRDEAAACRRCSIRWCAPRPTVAAPCTVGAHASHVVGWPDRRRARVPAGAADARRPSRDSSTAHVVARRRSRDLGQPVMLHRAGRVRTTCRHPRDLRLHDDQRARAGSGLDGREDTRSHLTGMVRASASPGRRSTRCLEFSFPGEPGCGKVVHGSLARHRVGRGCARWCWRPSPRSPVSTSARNPGGSSSPSNRRREVPT